MLAEQKEAKRGERAGGQENRGECPGQEEPEQRHQDVEADLDEQGPIGAVDVVDIGIDPSPPVRRREGPGRQNIGDVHAHEIVAERTGEQDEGDGRQDDHRQDEPVGAPQGEIGDGRRALQRLENHEARDDEEQEDADGTVPHNRDVRKCVTVGIQALSRRWRPTGEVMKQDNQDDRYAAKPVQLFNSFVAHENTTLLREICYHGRPRYSISVC